MLNIDNVNVELTEEILWRYKELKNIKKLYFANIKKKTISIGNIQKIIHENTSESKYILRSSIPLIYAHWEGFFKKYIDLFNLRLNIFSVNYNKLDNILLSILTKDKHTIKHKKSDFKFTEILIDTESNLSWKVIEKFAIKYNFNTKRLASYQDKINQLLKIRNGISHGENAYHFENFVKIQEFIDLILKLMIILKNLVIDCLQYKNYYKIV